MLRRFPLYLSLLLLTQCSKCKRDAPTPLLPQDPLSLLPPETQTGAGTFGCLVNGIAYTTTSSIAVSGEWISASKLAVGATLYPNGHQDQLLRSFTLVMNGQLTAPPVAAFSIVVAGNQAVFTPGLDQFYAFSGNATCAYRGAFFKTGQIELRRFDGVQRIASGRFAFTLYEPGGCDTLRVTSGRFDVKF
ncbi:hypothetical protein [Hymenobacter negativus]|uniref:Lipoprotein n=1 Tax=Hymenobacter negativus TaxID=2795026 RepID=A0ABS3Q9S5_9BACT|nr:hypothetical protein [Hymenobacter negativus]MBO2007912.1 hypothetical protein [Hymenobacter negativus]